MHFQGSLGLPAHMDCSCVRKVRKNGGAPLLPSTDQAVLHVSLAVGETFDRVVDNVPQHRFLRTLGADHLVSEGLNGLFFCSVTQHVSRIPNFESIFEI